MALLTKAMATGRAQLMSETFVSRILTDPGGAAHRRSSTSTPTVPSTPWTAGLVVVAGGHAIETPRLLLLSEPRPPGARAPP